MPLWMIGDGLSLVNCIVDNPVSGLHRFLCHAIMSIAMIQKGP